MTHAPNTLLVNPTISSRGSARFPWSLLHLAAALDRGGTSRVVDGNIDRDVVAATLQAIEAERFDAVGISVMGGPQMEPSIAVSKAIRERFPRMPIVWGGYFPTLYTETALSAPYVDYAIRGQGEESLPELMAALSRPEEVRAFLQDLCTPAELEAMADRWRVVPLLLKGVPYREIHDLTEVSVTTIGRVARTLESGTGGYSTAMRRQQSRPSAASH